MITRESIETAYSFLHQKRNVYIHSNLSWQRDDIEYAISSYVDRGTPGGDAYCCRYLISSSLPVTESMMKPRTTMPFGTSGCVLMVSTVRLTEVGVSLKPSSH